MRLLLILLFATYSFLATSHGQDDLTVLQASPEGVPPDQFLEKWLKGEFYRLVERRSEAFEKMLKSEAAARNWQTERRQFFLKQIGGLPERTPLNAQVVGTLEGDGYRIEKILFESRPRFHVTGNLYLPTRSPPPWPAVLIPCGHSHDGKAAGQYQRACILLARHGLAAMCYDPIGQGERYQILDTAQQHTRFDDAPHVATPHPHVRLMCTTEHTLVGLGSALLGANVAQFRIWDGMRVIDYLQSRSDVIASKIGCAGNSGGGTETAYLMALDDRIVAAAPGCYLTTFRRLIDTKGPQDGEQNIFGQIEFGMDEADYCIMRAPKPTLICAGVRDVTFDFRGTWELFLDAKRFYSRLGHPESMDINAPDAPHGFTIQQREATTRFMSRWLLGNDVEIREASLPDMPIDEQLWELSAPVWTSAQLRCTPDGQVLLLPGERSAFEINSELARSLRTRRGIVWKRRNETEKRQLIRATLGMRVLGPDVAREVTTVGTLEQERSTLRKLVLNLDEGLQLPALLWVPAQPNGRATLYLHGTSMKLDAAPGGPIDKLVQQGHTVLAAELRGIGETETGRSKRAFGAGRFGQDNLEILTAYLMGKSYVGMRAEDVLHWTRALESGGLMGRPVAIDLAAIGEASIPALHAAALADPPYGSVTLRQMIPSWETIVDAGESFDQSVNVVHGALQHYDLDDLVELAGRERVKLLEPADPRRGE